MSTTVNSIQERLSTSGARDVKFLFNADLQSRLPSAVQAQANFLLDSYLKGYVEEHTPVGDLTFIQQRVKPRPSGRGGCQIQ
jgi:hypothetical protein